MQPNIIYLELLEDTNTRFSDYRKSKLIMEHYVNLIGDHPDKHKYKNQLFDMLSKAYEDQGGIHGSGFSSPDDMVENLPMWKLHTKNGQLKAAVLYKDRGIGRKMVAVASDGSDEGKRGASDMLKSDFVQSRAHSEVSGKALSFIKKQVHVGSLAKSFEDAKAYHAARGDEISRPAEDDPEVLRHPELKDKFYSRKIGDQVHTKILLGTLGKTITTP
jgi:hypothetical protein